MIPRRSLLLAAPLVVMAPRIARPWLIQSPNPSDPNFSSVVLLCHMDGTNGSTTFIDSSAAAHSLTSSGTAKLTTAQKKFGTASFDVTGTSADNVQAADSADWEFGSGQFTVEGWIQPTSTPSGVKGVLAHWGTSGNLGWFFGYNSTTLSFFYSTTGSDNPSVGAAASPTTNVWTFIAADRDASNVLRVYSAGSVVASATVSATFFNSTRTLKIGNDETGSRGFPGYLDELRITKGVARYGGAFTPPTAPFPNH